MTLDAEDLIKTFNDLTNQPFNSLRGRGIFRSTTRKHANHGMNYRQRKRALSEFIRDR